MKINKKKFLNLIVFFTFFISSTSFHCLAQQTGTEIPLFYWKHPHIQNFGDYLSLKLVERIVGQPISVYKKTMPQKKLLAIGSILSFAEENDVIWGSGIKDKNLDLNRYQFKQLDVRAVRGPLTRAFLNEHFAIQCPAVYGDPALLLPYLFPEFKRPPNPLYNCTLIVHYSEENLFPKSRYPYAVYASEPWDEIIRKIIDSAFVISTSLHGIIVAEAFGVPARMLRVTENEPLFKFKDYYLGTQRLHFEYATSVEEALRMGGEPPFKCDLQKLYESFPFEFWSQSKKQKINFQVLL